MPIRSDVEIVKIEVRGQDILTDIRRACAAQAARNPDPRHLVSTFVLKTDPAFDTLFLVFDLAG